MHRGFCRIKRLQGYKRYCRSQILSPFQQARVDQLKRYMTKMAVDMRCVTLEGKVAKKHTLCCNSCWHTSIDSYNWEHEEGCHSWDFGMHLFPEEEVSRDLARGPRIVYPV